MKNLKRLLIPVTCLLLCAVMALPAYAFSPSDPDASPLEEFLGTNERNNVFSLDCGAKLIGYFEISNNFVEKFAKNEK